MLDLLVTMLRQSHQRLQTYLYRPNQKPSPNLWVRVSPEGLGFDPGLRPGLGVRRTMHTARCAAVRRLRTAGRRGQTPQFRVAGVWGRAATSAAGDGEAADCVGGPRSQTAALLVSVSVSSVPSVVNFRGVICRTGRRRRYLTGGSRRHGRRRRLRRRRARGPCGRLPIRR